MSRVFKLRAVTVGARVLAPRLSRSVWILEIGALSNALGTGFVLPFSAIYFHNIRRFSLGEAAAIVAVISAVGIVTGPLAGTTSDRWSAKATLVVSLGMMAIGYAGFPFVRQPWEAFGLAIVAGAGNGSFYPSEASILGDLTPPEQRHISFSLQRVMTNLGYGIGALIGGFIASTSKPGTFNALFFIDAVTFIIFIAVLGFVASPSASAQRPQGELSPRYREVFRDHAFIGLLAVNALLVTVGYSLFETLVPLYAKNDASVGDHVIGAFFLVNTAVIVLAQLPITHLLEGRRRMPMLASLGGLWAVGLLIVLAGGQLLTGVAAGGVLMFAFFVFTIGECLQSAILSPTAADLAPPALLGRYMALVSFTWQFGLAVGPAAGGFVLQASSWALWVIGACLCLCGSIAALLLEPRLPHRVRSTPLTPPRPTPSSPATKAV